MSYQSRAVGAINITKSAQDIANSSEGKLTDLMANPEYLRHSSSVIHEALKQGFDVLQLPNGDIVTTGTKVIVTTYSWDESKSRLSKRSKSADELNQKPKRRSKKSDD